MEIYTNIEKFKTPRTQLFPCMQKSRDHQGAVSAKCEADHNRPGGLGRNTVPKMDLRYQPDGLDLLLPWPLALWSSPSVFSLSISSSCFGVWKISCYPLGSSFPPVMTFRPEKSPICHCRPETEGTSCGVPWLTLSLGFHILKVNVFPSSILGMAAWHQYEWRVLSPVSSQAVNRSVSLAEKLDRWKKSDLLPAYH